MKLINRLLTIIISIAIASTMWVPAFAVSQDKSPPEIKAKGAIIMDAETGDILYEKNARTKLEPASVTKIVTCLLALEHLEMDQEITVKANGNPMGNVISVKKGEVFTAEQLIYALMLTSANDAAVVLAEEIGGSQSAFCKMMNEKAAECGAENSNFMNPNGLNWAGHEAHLTTAYDLAMVMKTALENETFRQIIGTLYYEIPATNKSDARQLINTNRFLWDEDTLDKIDMKNVGAESKEDIWIPEYEGVIGGKTGKTSTAGDCFVAAANCSGRTLISVMLFSTDNDRYKDSMALWDYCIETYYDTHVIAPAGQPADEVRVKGGAVWAVEAVPAEDAVVATLPGEEPKGVRVDMETEPLTAPVKKGQEIGTLKVSMGGELVCERTLLAADDVEKGGPLSEYGIPDSVLPYVIGGAALVILAVILLIVRFKRRK